MIKRTRKIHSVYDAAISLLARREHTKWELTEKLIACGFKKSEIQSTIAKLIEQRYQSDERFAEHYVESCKNRGYGPYRILAELKERKVDYDLIDRHLKLSDNCWLEIAKEILKKKPKATKLKQMHFLYTRGFTMDQIKAIFKNLPMDLEEVHEN